MKEIKKLHKISAKLLATAMEKLKSRKSGAPQQSSLTDGFPSVITNFVAILVIHLFIYFYLLKLMHCRHLML